MSDRRSKESLAKIFVRSENNSKLISLANLVDFKEEGSAKILSRYNRQRAVTISANINEGYSLSEAIRYLEKTMENVSPQNQISWKGKSEELKETSNELFIIFTDRMEFSDSEITSFQTKEPFLSSKLTILPFGAPSDV